MRRAATAELPGEDLVRRGIADLAAGVESTEALLVSIGAPRLRRLGLDVPEPLPSPEHRLYEVLRAGHGDGAHSRYNALVRRLVSFERGCGSRGRPPCVSSRTRSASGASWARWEGRPAATETAIWQVEQPPSC